MNILQWHKQVELIKLYWIQALLALALVSILVWGMRKLWKAAGVTISVSPRESSLSKEARNRLARDIESALENALRRVQISMDTHAKPLRVQFSAESADIEEWRPLLGEIAEIFCSEEPRPSASDSLVERSDDPGAIDSSDDVGMHEHSVGRRPQRVFVEIRSEGASSSKRECFSECSDREAPLIVESYDEREGQLTVNPKSRHYHSEFTSWFGINSTMWDDGKRDAELRAVVKSGDQRWRFRRD